MTTSKELLTLGSAAERTFLRKWKGSKGERTALINAKAVVEFFGRDTHVGDIMVDEIDEFIIHLEGIGNMSSTVNRKLAALSTILTFAFDRGFIDRKPKIERLTEPEHRICWLNEREEAAIQAHFMRDDWPIMAEFVGFQIDTGLRPGETFRLTWKDADYDSGLLHVHGTKSGRPRTIPMTVRVEDMMKEQHDVHCFDRPFTVLTRNDVRREWDAMKVAFNRAGEAEFIPYCLRHTSASRLLSRGASITAIQQWLGHASVTTTMRYAHLQPTALHDLADLLN